jgi:hypothetical protein
MGVPVSARPVVGNWPVMLCLLGVELAVVVPVKVGRVTTFV